MTTAFAEVRAPVKVALIGCGAVSRLYYAPALRELEAAGRATLVALSDPDAAAVAAIQKLFPWAAATHDLAALSLHEFDLGIVASPHRLHAQQSIELLERKKSVLCEKPMATTLTDAQAMLDVAGLSAGLLAVGLVRRFFPAAETIRNLLSLNVIGNVRSFYFSEGDEYFRWPVTSPMYFRKRQAQGGVLLDIGVHALDLMLWWFGEPAELQYEDDAMGGVEVNCRMCCKYPEGVTGEVRLSRDCALANRYTIYGTKGWISWPVNEADRVEIGFATSRLALDAGLRQVREGKAHPEAGEAAGNFEQSFVDQLRNVVDAMQGCAELRVTAEDAAGSLRLIARCYEQRKLLPMPWLGESESRRAAALAADSG